MVPVLEKLSQEERDRISRLFNAKARALPHHDKQVQAEQGNPTHTFTRHGYQTGWESQLVRLVTGRTPDQPDDPEGSRDAVDKYREKESLPKNKRGEISFASADSVGAFLSPEVEAFVINLARAKAQPLMHFRFAETRAGKSGASQWVPYDYIDMVVRGPHALTGVSFHRGKRLKKLVEKDAIEAIEDFIHQKRVGPSDSTKTWADKREILDMMENSDLAAPFTRTAYRADYKLRFASMSDLLAHLEVDALWMRNANVCLRRFGNDWRIHTAYCVDCDGFPSPTRGGPSVKTGKWTGNLRVTENGPTTHMTPEWLA